VLAKITSGRTTVPPDVFASDLYKPSVDYGKPEQEGDQLPEPTLGSDPPGEPASPSTTEPEVMDIDEERLDNDDEPDWRIPYIECLIQGVLPPDQTQARWLARRAKSFMLLGGELYRHSASGILQCCIPTGEERQLLWEIHSGACGHHAAPRTLVGNAFRQGFYWPIAVADATEIVRSCEGCQFYARQTHLPAQALQMIPITWPFAMWGLDLVGPL
jgi:hypothetical protein